MSISLILFILIYSFGLLFTVIGNVAWGIYLYQFHYFINPGIRWWYASLPDLRYSFIIAIFIIIAYFKDRKDVFNSVFEIPQAKWLIIFYAVMAVKYFSAVWPAMHLQYFIDFSKLILLLYISYRVIDSPDKIEKLIWVFMLGNFYVGWEAHGIGRTNYDRLEEIGMTDGSNSNSTAAVLITSVPIYLFYLFNSKNIWPKVLCFVGLAYIFDGIVLINSRGAFLGIISGMIYYFLILFFSATIQNRTRRQILYTLVIGLGLFIYITDASFWMRMITLKEIDEGGGGAGRVLFWLKSIDLIKEYPFGVGVWGYQFLSPTFLPEEYLTEGMRAVHSTYFQALSEYGFIGPLILVGYILSTFKLAQKTRKYLHGKREYYQLNQLIAIEAGFFSFLVAAAFIDRLYAEMMYWFPLFIACFHNIYNRKRME